MSYCPSPSGRRLQYNVALLQRRQERLAKIATWCGVFLESHLEMWGENKAIHFYIKPFKKVTPAV